MGAKKRDSLRKTMAHTYTKNNKRTHTIMLAKKQRKAREWHIN